jgi:hypothetical protein
MPLKKIMPGPTHQRYYLKMNIVFFRNSILKNQHKQNNSKKSYINKMTCKTHDLGLETVINLLEIVFEDNHKTNIIF